MRAAGRDDADDGGSRFGVGVAAAEHPRFWSDHDLPQFALGARVVERQLHVLEHVQWRRNPDNVPKQKRDPRPRRRFALCFRVGGDG